RRNGHAIAAGDHRDHRPDATDRSGAAGVDRACGALGVRPPQRLPLPVARSDGRDPTRGIARGARRQLDDQPLLPSREASRRAAGARVLRGAHESARSRAGARRLGHALTAKSRTPGIAAAAERRCSWVPDGDRLYADYHDREWGFPVADDRRLFEKLCLEGFQAGLSWRTILGKREAFRETFAGFDFDRVARFTDRDIQRALLNSAIVRHRGKIESARNNAKRVRELVDE